MNDKISLAELIESYNYAKDPATDRTFLALRFIENHIRAVGLPAYTSIEGTVILAFKLADEFILKAKQEQK